MQASELKKAILKSDEQFRLHLKNEHYAFHENLRELKATQAVQEATKELPDLDFEDSIELSVRSENIESNKRAGKSEKANDPPLQTPSPDLVNIETTVEIPTKNIMKEKVLETFSIVNNKIRSIKNSGKNPVADPQPDKKAEVEQEPTKTLKEKMSAVAVASSTVSSVKNLNTNPVACPQIEKEQSVEECLRILNTYELEDFWKDADSMLVEALEDFDSIDSTSEAGQISVPITKCANSPQKPQKLAKNHRRSSWTHIKSGRVKEQRKKRLTMEAIKVTTRSSLKTILTEKSQKLLLPTVVSTKEPSTATSSASSSLDKVQKQTRAVVTRQSVQAETSSKPPESIPTSTAKRPEPKPAVETLKALEPMSTLSNKTQATAWKSLEPMISFAVKKSQAGTLKLQASFSSSAVKNYPATNTKPHGSTSADVSLNSVSPKSTKKLSVPSDRIRNSGNTNSTIGNDERKIVPIAVTQKVSNPIPSYFVKSINLSPGGIKKPEIPSSPATVIPPSNIKSPSSLNLSSIELIEISSDEEIEKSISKEPKKFDVDVLNCLTSDQIMEMTNLIANILPENVAKDKTPPKSNKRKRKKKEKKQSKKMKIDNETLKVSDVPTFKLQPIRTRRESILKMPKFRIVKMIKPHDN